MKRALIALLFCSTLVFSCKDDDGNTDITLPTASSDVNILLVIADDMGQDACPGYDVGAVKPNMPNLQKLIQQGVTYNNVWSYPLCAPTRASILTGRYGYRTNVLNVGTHGTISESEKTLQSYLDENTSNKYAHGIFGKWHLSRDANTATNMGVGTYSGLLSGALQDYSSWQFTENGSTSTYNGYATTKFTDLALDWIGDQTKPWFCWLAYTTPHTPLHLPPTEMHSQGSLPNDEASISANPEPYFMAMIESIDYELGRIMDSIPPSVLDNTVIIFLGDNGTSRNVLQSPFSRAQGKGTIYQGGVNVPMIIAGKNVNRANQKDNSLITTSDLFISIAQMAGVGNDQYEDSYSFIPTFETENAGPREFAYTEQNTDTYPNQFTVRNARYKLIEFDASNREFYDLQLDPYEKVNLLSGMLSDSESTALTDLENEAARIRQ